MLHICFDIDDTLNNLMEEYLKWFNKIYSSNTPISYNEIIDNPPHEILRISEKHYRQTLYQFRMINYKYLIPDPNVLKWFKKHGHRAHFSVLTSAFKDCIPVVANWVFLHFGEWIRTFAFVPSAIDENDIHNVYDIDKAGWLHRNNVDIYIDDNPITCWKVSLCNIKSHCVKQPWSSLSEIGINNILKSIGKKLK
jgi:hypothetical protein